MAFGKKSIERLAPGVRSKMEANRIDRVVHDTEVKMLKVPAQGTPLGDGYFLSAVEAQIIAPTSVCFVCGASKEEVTLKLTGTCEACWKRADGC